MAAGVTFEPIQTHTFTGSQDTVTFNSISQLYTHLFILVSGQYSSSGVDYYFRFNGSSASDYYKTSLGFSVSTQASNRGDNLNSIGSYCFSGGAANLPDAVQAWIPYYTNTTFKKNIQIRTSGGTETARCSGFWNSTSAITSLTLLTFGNNLTAGSTITLFGITEA